MPPATNTLSATTRMSTKRAIWRRLASANRELWLILAMFAIIMLMDVVIAEPRILLYLFTIPTVYSAYSYGRRHAVMTALASAFLILCMAWLKPEFLQAFGFQFQIDAWSEFVAWAGILIITAYMMGTLYDRMQGNMRDLRQSYDGMLTLLQHLACDGKYMQNHPHRVSLMASKIAEQMGLSNERVEDTRRAALLHEVENVGITHAMLFQAANLQEEELRTLQEHLEGGKELPATTGSSLRRVIPILLAFHAADEKAKNSEGLAHIPVESKILLIACHYDLLTSAQEKRIAPSEAMERITQRAGIEYDGEAVDAMVKVFRKRGMDERELATARIAVSKS